MHVPVGNSQQNIDVSWTIKAQKTDTIWVSNINFLREILMTLKSPKHFFNSLERKVK